MTEHESAMTSAQEAAFLRSLADGLERSVAHTDAILSLPATAEMTTYPQMRDTVAAIHEHIHDLLLLAYELDPPAPPAEQGATDA